MARAQGPVSIGGFNFAAGGSSIRKNYTLVGRVPLGATIEQNQYSKLVQDGSLAAKPPSGGFHQRASRQRSHQHSLWRGSRNCAEFQPDSC